MKPIMKPTTKPSMKPWEYETYRITYQLKDEKVTSEVELDARNLLELIVLFHDFLNDEPSEILSSIHFIECFKLPQVFPDYLNQRDMIDYGYTWCGMIPMREKKALELFQEYKRVYALMPDDSESEIESKEQLMAHADAGGMFGIKAKLITLNFDS